MGLLQPTGIKADQILFRWYPNLDGGGATIRVKGKVVPVLD
jgi:hypothetical protein